MKARAAVNLYIEGCAVHKHRDDVPLDRHHVWPLGKGGPDSEDNVVLLCPNGHREVHEYMREIEYFYKNGVFRLDKRNFGQKTRILAEKGFFSYYRP